MGPTHDHDKQEHSTTTQPEDSTTTERGRPSALAAARHDFDPMSLLFGLVFLGVAGLGFAGELGAIRVVDGHWLGPVLLITIGLLLITTLRRKE